jgi:uncharacterized Zn-binding protein involved in type VI secretion
MPAAALNGGASSVTCTDGAKGSGCGRNVWHWDAGITSASDAGSSDVLINGKGAVREGDVMASHPDGDPCVGGPVNHTPTLSSFSSTVFVNGKGMGRVGDVYNGGTGFSHTIASGSGNVFAG